jgi:hypothetical protein
VIVVCCLFYSNFRSWELAAGAASGMTKEGRVLYVWMLLIGPLPLVDSLMVQFLGGPMGGALQRSMVPAEH